MDPIQYRDEIIRPTLEDMGLYSESAVVLILGTFIIESNLEYVVQLGGGPARGLGQMEKITHRSIWDDYLEYKPVLRNRLIRLCPGAHPLGRVIWDQRYAVIMTRLKYLPFPRALPSPTNIRGHGRYWKDCYNTPLGKGKVPKFVRRFKKVMADAA